MDNPPKEIKQVAITSCSLKLDSDEISAMPRVISMIPLDIPLAYAGSIFSVENNFSKGNATNLRMFRSNAMSINI